MKESTVTTHGIDVAIWEAGAGHPILVIHGLGLDHLGLSEELEGMFGDDPGWRRVYVDLPGIGGTPGPEWLASADSLLEVVLAVIQARMGEERFAMIGQSYGGYLALGVSQRLAERMSGLALLIPVIEPSTEERLLPAPMKLRLHDAMDQLPLEFLTEFRELIVTESPELATALLRSWIPSLNRADQEFIGHLQRDAYSFTTLDLAGAKFSAPSLMICGRHDAVVGYEQATGLLPGFERGTLAVLDGAGHLAQLEKSSIARSLMGDWLQRVRDEEGRLGT